jgi:transcriptional regulator with XRE-family HTH domain
MPRESLGERRARLEPGARWLRDQRLRRSWTGAELGTRLGVSQERVSAYERAQDEPPISVVRKLATAFGLTELEVFIGLGIPLPKEVMPSGMTDQETVAFVKKHWPEAWAEIIGADPPRRPRTTRRNTQVNPASRTGEPGGAASQQS